MILHGEVEETGGFLFQRGVELAAAKALVDVAKAAAEGVVLLPAEEVGFCREAHALNKGAAFLIAQPVGAGGAFRSREALVVVVIQQGEPPAVALDDAQHLFTVHFICRAVQQLKHLPQLAHAFFMHHIAAQQVFSQPLCSPDAELCTAHAVYPIAYRDNHVEVVKQHLSSHTAGALLANYKGILYSSIFLKLCAFEDALYMLANILSRSLKEIGHHLLGHPEGVVLQAQLKLHRAIRRGVEKNIIVRCIEHDFIIRFSP